MNFNNKIIRWINFCRASKKLVKVQGLTIRLYDRSDTYNQSIEKNDTAENNCKTKNALFVNRETLYDDGLLVWLWIRFFI